jgi:hypothetical protein
MNYPQIKPSLNLDFSNTKTLDPRINFRRGTPGAYYDGKTYAKAEENLIANSTVWSEWNLINMTVYDNQPSPDGENTAYKLSPTDSVATAAILPGVSKGTEAQTWSIYVKMDSPDYTAIALYWNSSGTTHARFNLLTGQVTLDHGSGHIEASMEDVGDGWWRCVATHSQHSSTSATMYVLVDDTSATDFMRWSETDGPDGVKGLFAWHPQIEARDFVTAYTPTNGTPITKYQPQLMFASPDQPRFDHDVLTGESKGLLIEESRTNLIEYSQDFDNVAWTESRSFFSLNKIIAPDGTLTGREFIENTELGGHYVRSTFSVQSGNLTFSVYAKKANGSRYIQLRPYGLGNGIAYANFDVTNGVVVENGTGGSEFVSAKIIDVGNGWYRCIMTANYSTSPTGALFGLSNTAVEIPYITGDNYSGIYIWGAQVEAGSFASSYIKTSGASATRSADDASITGENFSSWYRQDEGSIYSEASTSDFRSSYPRFMINDGTANNRIVTSFFGQQGLRVQSNGNDYINVSNAVSSDNRNYHKRAIALKKDSFSFYTGGESILSDSAGEMPISVNTFAFYNNLAADGADYLNGHIKKLSYYPQRLTNEQLQQLTK